MNEPLRAVDEVRRLLLDEVVPLPPARVPLEEAAGLILAEDVVAPHDLPRFANAAMDGFAIRSSDVAAPPVRLRVVGKVAAGHPATVGIRSGEAVEIATGAPLPEGADAVLPVEQTAMGGTGGSTVVATGGVEPGRHVRGAAEDLAEGELVLARGSVLGPAQLAAVAALGRTDATVHPRPRVAVLPTGDEVRPRGGDLGAAQIHDAVSVPLSALLREIGAVPLPGDVVPDDASLLEDAVRRAASVADAVLTVGGVSMGSRDLVRSLTGLDAEVVSYRLALRPAKPFAFGRVGGVPLFGLPGNPAAALVAFEELVRPAILRMLGKPPSLRPTVEATLTEPFSQPRGRFHLVRVQAWREGPRLLVRPAGKPGAAMVGSLAAATGWMEVGADVEALPAGAPVRVRLLVDPR